MQLHEGNEAEHLGLFWQKPGKHPRQPQPVVGLGRVTQQRRALQRGELFDVTPVAAQEVDRPPPRGGHQPSARVVGNSLFRPFLQRCDEAVLDHLLGNVEVAENPDHCGGEPSGLLAEDRSDRRFGGGPAARQRSWRSCEWSTIGRISTVPGHSLAISSASSRSLTSMRAKPPIISLDSINGPSVTVTLPFLRETVVAVLGPRSSSPPTTFPSFVYFSNHLFDFS